MSGSHEAIVSLAELLLAQKDALITQWKRRVLEDPALPEANRLTEPELRDHVPELIDRLIVCLHDRKAASETGGRRIGRDSLSRSHAQERYEQRYTLAAVLREWSHFRAALMQLCVDQRIALESSEALFVHSMIDEAAALAAGSLHDAARASMEDNEQRYRRLAAELTAVIGSMPDAVYMGDETGIRLANASALDLLGIERPEELKVDVSSLPERLHMRDATTGEPLKDASFLLAAREERVMRDILVRHPATGADLVLRCAMGPIWLAEQTIGAVAVVSDVTLERNAAKALRDEAELRETFMGILGHDLRSPLAAIVTSAHAALHREDVAEPLRKNVRRMLVGAQRMSRMIDDLLDVTRVRIGEGLALQLVPVDLSEVCEQAIDECEAAHPGRTIERHTAGATLVRCDPDRVSQVVTNLVNNALQHGKLDAPVRVELCGDDDGVELRVSNEGPTIAPALQETLFDPFRRVSTAARHGLGLGLYIVREIARAHGGSVKLASAHERTTFTVRLPRDA